MLSSKAKYGIHAVLILTERHQDGPVQISNIAETGKIPRKFLEQILLQLKLQGILHSVKGRKGGYLLGKSPKDITMGQIIRILDGPLAPTPCVSVTAYRECPECLDEKSCGIKLVMKDVRDAISEILDHTTMSEVLARVKETKLR